MNCQAVAEAEKNMVFAARLTQQGHKIASMDDLMELYEKSFSVQTVAAMGALPHPTIQKFAVITVAIVGASRRFLAQITRHQNEVKFMSASLQYSNYTGQADFAVPYSIMTAPAVVRELYLKSCHESMKCYEALCTAGSGHDAAGYATPQGLRNVLLISATPYQWKHIISQRVCRRNTDETRIVLLKVWKELYELSPALFAPSLTGPFCQMDRCLEGKMTCGRKLEADMTPEDILNELLGEFQPEISEKVPAEFHCDCSKERVEKVLVSLGEKELTSMIKEGNPIELKCHFCNSGYTFAPEELKELLKKSR